MIGGVSPYSYSTGFDFAAYAASRARSAASREAVSRTPVQPVAPVEETTPETAPIPRNMGISIREGADPAEMAVRMRIQYAEDSVVPSHEAEGEDALGEMKSAQEVMEEGECQTCEERKYQDGSNDPGVSFKTAAHISPEMSNATVRGHEMEHVVRNRAKAEREDREIVSQSVTLSTAICPECGKIYTSGGTTRTVYSGVQQPEQEKQTQPARTPFSAVA